MSRLKELRQYIICSAIYHHDDKVTVQTEMRTLLRIS